MKSIWLMFACIALISSSYAGNGQESGSQAAVTVHDIVGLREFSGLNVCSEKALIAVRVDSPSLTENRVRHNWVIIEWPSGDVRLRADAGETLNTSGYFEDVKPHWSPDCEWIYYRALHSNEIQVWRLNVTSGEQENVTSDSADILNFAIIESGRSLVYEADVGRAAILSAEAHEYQNGVLIDDTIYPWHQLTRTLPFGGRWATVRRWGVSSVGHLLSRTPPTYKTITIADRKVRTATETEKSMLLYEGSDLTDWAPELNSRFVISPMGGSAAVALPKAHTISGRPIKFLLGSVHRETPSKIHECDDPICIAENLVVLGWSADGASIFFIAEQTRGAAGVYAWTPSSGHMRTILETEGTLGALSSAKRYKSMECPIISGAAICTAADHGSPPILIAISLMTGATETVYDPNLDLRTKFALTTKRIGWHDEFGRDVSGVLVYPRNFEAGAQYPLVITTYRCPGFLTGGIADGGPEYVLAEHGFLVLCIDFNWDLPPPDVTSEYSSGPGRYVAALAEYESAIDLLVERGLADRNRIGITGLSFSSQSVSYALTHSNYFDVAALRAIGVWEPAHEMFFRPGMELADAVTKSHNIGEDGRDAEIIYKDIAVSLRADRVDIPVLVQASDNEYLGSLPAFTALKKLGKPVEMHVFPGETHQLHQPIHRLVNFERNLDWFRFWLLGEEDANPDKKEQYVRWSHLRILQEEASKKAEGMIKNGAGTD